MVFSQLKHTECKVRPWPFFLLSSPGCSVKTRAEKTQKRIPSISALSKRIGTGETPLHIETIGCHRGSTKGILSNERIFTRLQCQMKASSRAFVWCSAQRKLFFSSHSVWICSSSTGYRSPLYSSVFNTCFQLGQEVLVGFAQR